MDLVTLLPSERIGNKRPALGCGGDGTHLEEGETGGGVGPAFDRAIVTLGTFAGAPLDFP